MQKKLYKWQRDYLITSGIFPSCEYPADLESVIELLPEDVTFNDERYELIITSGYVRYVPFGDNNPKDIHDMTTMLCYSEESKAQSPTTLDACWQVLVALHKIGIIPVKQPLNKLY